MHVKLTVDNEVGWRYENYKLQLAPMSPMLPGWSTRFSGIERLTSNTRTCKLLFFQQNYPHQDPSYAMESYKHSLLHGNLLQKAHKLSATKIELSHWSTGNGTHLWLADKNKMILWAILTELKRGTYSQMYYNFSFFVTYHFQTSRWTSLNVPNDSWFISDISQGGIATII